MTDCAVIRTGAFGDVLMASAVFPGLTQQGYRVTFVTSVEGEEMCRHDPYLGGRIRVVPQVKAEEDVQRWATLAEEFPHVVNLVNGMECQVLYHPAQIAYYWPEDARRRTANRSYLGQYCLQAGVQGPARIRFQPSVEELEWVGAQQAKIGPYVVWALSGSMPHKLYPHLTRAITQVLARTPVSIILSGGLKDREYENAVLDAVGAFLPEALGRVHSWVGIGSLRRAMALAQQAVAVVGPETALPMAVAHEPQVAKVVLLSHSSVTNLTGDWVNTVSLTGDVPCYPCHRLHYDHTFCPQDEATKGAACAAAIGPSRVADAVVRAWEASRACVC